MLNKISERGSFKVINDSRTLILDIDIIFANGTWLSNNVRNVEILHSEYTILRNDREGRGGIEVSCWVLGRDYLKLVKLSITMIWNISGAIYYYVKL